MLKSLLSVCSVNLHTRLKRKAKTWMRASGLKRNVEYALQA